MSMTGLKTFDDTIYKTNTWLHEICARIGWEDRRRGHRLMRHALRAIRDRMPPGEMAHLSAQLPLLMRGIFFEGWQPNRRDAPGQTLDAFLAEIAEPFSDDPDFDPEAAFREFVAVMRMHVSKGEIEDVRRVMPDEIKTLWVEP